MSNDSATLIRASHAMDDLLAKLRQVEQERDEARGHLRDIVDAHDRGDTEARENAIHYADFWLKGGI